jgi:hypothetical protein
VDPLIVMSRKYPSLTLGLTSALWLHGLLEQRPESDWWILANKSRRPQLPQPQAKFVRSSWPLEDRELLRYDGTGMQAQSIVRALIDSVRFEHLVGPQATRAVLKHALSCGAVTQDSLVERASALHFRRPMKAALRAL